MQMIVEVSGDKVADKGGFYKTKQRTRSKRENISEIIRLRD